MPERRDLIAMAATIAADSAWLYPALGLLGAVFGLDGPLLPPAMIVAILLLGVILGWVVAGVVEEAAERAPFQALSGLAVVYLAISTIAAEGGIDLLWAPHLIGGVLSAQAMASLIAATTAAGFLWYRGIRIAVETHLQFRLLQTFRTGIVALAVLILVEQAFDVDFSATFMLVPFFAVSLAGLAFARLPSGGAWARTVGLAVAVVIGGGFVVGLIGAVVGGRGLGLLATGWERLVAVIA
ncbi:MAG: hypothetical protein QF491_14690, partial [Alphaproteobacteria bacterium]|nr:hypothetical protein [Alphaproteobacteria bacterium]